MSLLLSKIIPQLIYPLGAALLLSLIALFALRLNYKKTAAWCFGVGFVYLGLFALPPFSDWLRNQLERQHPYLNAEALPTADAIVVLGGAVEAAYPPRVPYPNLNSAADRIWHAARLYHAGKAPIIIASGGQLPWSQHLSSEAESMRVFLQALNVPAKAILQEDLSSTTYQNALYTQQLLDKRGGRSILLVTSALHMSRALATFRAAGIEHIIPAPSDVEVIYPDPTLLYWLPSTEALDGSTRALKELIGLLVYRLLGRAV